MVAPTFPKTLQSKRTAAVGPPLRCVVDKGLPPCEHFFQGLWAPSPLDSSLMVPSDLTFAVNKIIELGSRIDVWRENQMRIFEDALASLAELSSTLEAGRAGTPSKCSAHVNLAENALAAGSVGWPDRALAADAMEGLKPMGTQTSFNIIYIYIYIAPQI